MNWASLGRKIAAAGLPVLGGAMAGGGGAEIGRRVANALGAEPTPDSIAKAFIADPDGARLALSKQEAELAASLSKDQVELAKVEMEDRQDARTHRDLDGTRRQLAVALLLAVPVFGLGLAFLDHRYDLSDMVLGALIALLGAMGKDLSGALSFFFGTSVGSSDKARTIDKIVSK